MLTFRARKNILTRRRYQHRFAQELNLETKCSPWLEKVHYSFSYWPSSDVMLHYFLNSNIIIDTNWYQSNYWIDCINLKVSIAIKLITI